MRLDEALLVGYGARVYSWDGPWVSLGKFQSADRALLPGAPVGVVTRPTGGKAVLHGHDITVGIGLPWEALGVLSVEDRSVKAAYRPLATAICRSLQDCGVPCSLGEDTCFVRGAGQLSDCFSHVSPNDIVDTATGQKVCGCALKTTDRAALVQASIPTGVPLVDPGLVFEKYSKQPQRSIDVAEFARALQQALSDLNA